LAHWWRLNSKENKRLKVIWSGGVSHYEDWYSIKEPLNKLMGEFDFDLYMIGANYAGVVEEKYKERVKILPWVPFMAHSYRMMSLQADIAIIPLADLPFNRYKSSIKWLEMSAMAVPSVVSDIPPYAHDISKSTAIGYKTPRQFYKALKSLLENKGLRKNIGNAAYQWVRENRTLERTTRDILVPAYEKLLDRTVKS
jgi:glycosyltransferase involved in cell wall biosynthesis